MFFMIDVIKRTCALATIAANFINFRLISYEDSGNEDSPILASLGDTARLVRGDAEFMRTSAGGEYASIAHVGRLRAQRSA